MRPHDILGGCNIQADIVFLLDSSGSLKQDGWNKVLSFTRDMIHSLPIGPVRVGVISFSFTADVEFKLDTFTDKTAMGNKVNGLTWKNSWTHTPQALERARTIIFQSSAGDRPSIRNYAVVLTDGEPRLDQVQNAKMLQDTFDQAAQLRGSGVEIFAIGVGKNKIMILNTNFL